MTLENLTLEISLGNAVVIIVAIIGGVWAIVKTTSSHLNKRVDDVRDEIKQLRSDMDSMRVAVVYDSNRKTPIRKEDRDEG